MFGIPRYPPMYAPGIRPPFPLRPPGTVLPLLPRAPVAGIRGPIMSPILRPPLIPSVTPAEKPQTIVYVGKIAPSVENDFVLSLLNLCGAIKSWKRAQNPSDGTPGGFGFCEFESAEGVLRALRLLSKFKVDGQELMLNVNQATRKSLEDYVEKKSETTKKDEGNDAVLVNERGGVDAEKHDPVVCTGDSSKNTDDCSDNKDKDNSQFGIITLEEREADAEVLRKLKSMIEERLKARPLPPPPPPPRADQTENLNPETPVKARDNESDAEISKKDMLEYKHDDDTTSDNKHVNDQDKNEPRSPERSRRETGSPEKNRRDYGSPERSRRYDRASRDRERDRDRDRDLRREKEREIERYERERERERVKRERDRESRTREAEQLYRERVKDWELREREKEYHRMQEKNREKDRQHQRRKEIRDQERESDEDDNDESSRKHRRKLEEKRKKRLREKDEDLADRLKEEEEIIEAERRAEEEHKQQLEQEKMKSMVSPSQMENGGSGFFPGHEFEVEDKDMPEETTNAEFVADGTGEESYGEEANAAPDGSQLAPIKKLGFGLVGSGKRTAVPSVFNAEEDDGQEEKKLRPLVPIDYSTEELQMAQHDSSGGIPAHVMEPPKRVSSAGSKEERAEAEREASRYPHDRHSYQDRDRNDADIGRFRDGSRDRDREHRSNKLRAADNKKLLDAKQLIDMIPKTKDELFSYDINWAIYDKHELHERMRPWIGKKITEFLGEEETSLVDYIVSSMQKHVKAGKMLELLQSILDDEAEMFVLKMWRMLIFEIKRVETGLSKRCF